MIAAAPDNENELLLRLSTGDEQAFKQLFTHYWDKIYSVALTYTKSPMLSEEIVQDVFLKVWLKREQMAAIERFDQYLFIIARNHIYNELRQKMADQPLRVAMEQQLVETSALPEQAIIHKEVTHLINKAVTQLPTQQRLVYEFSRNEGLDYLAIANKLGISRSTVKNHMTKALHTLRVYLNTHNGELLMAGFIIRIFS